MDTLKYEILLNSIETGSISAAAEKMGYSQPGASHMINSLENELGLKLISRTKNGVKLTPTGKALLPYIKNVVSENNSLLQAASEMSGLLKGSLLIGSMDT
ncbi:MAG: LysR family transcriptional regulator, partial [Firmicutes bacterium]|nr:LysR family transcriptional regulator [Bacillota bacterium]